MPRFRRKRIKVVRDQMEARRVNSGVDVVVSQDIALKYVQCMNQMRWKSDPNFVIH